MTKILAGGLLVFAGAAVMAAQQTPQAPRPAVSRAVQQLPATGGSPSAADAAKYRTWLNQYCVGCHNSRTKSPAEDPVNLETASLDNLMPQAAMWERVIRKLAVRAMPPQGSKHPEEPEYVAFTGWLAGSLDHAWAGKSTPGRYVVHRLNRTEMATPCAICSRSTWTSRNCCRATARTSASTTSPRRSRRRRCCSSVPSRRRSASARSRWAMRRAPRQPEYGISREFTQSGYIEGLPLGTRGGTVVRHVFPADGEYKLSGRLVRGVEEGYAGVEGNDQPHTFVITVDGAEAYSAQIGGQKDHEVQVRDMNEARVLIDARMTGKVVVTAGPHDIGFTWKDRPSERQTWQPARRDSQSPHDRRPAAAEDGRRRRPVQGHGHQRDAEPRKDPL
jgi:hypothetical protein